jgi:DNA-binding CsgD family transcriptional regulator
MSIPVLGRGVELAAVDQFVEALALGPAGLVLEGEAGIGKTTLWDIACAAARERGRRVLACRGAAAEARMSYAALSALLADVDDEALARLPGPQRDALNAALLRARPASGTPPDRRAVATGFVSLLDRLALDAPVVVAIDDLQWLDVSSAEAVRFAARRLSGPVGVLATERRPDPAGERALSELRHPGRLLRLRLGPLASEDVRRLLTQRTGRRLTRAVIDRIDDTAGGNPFVALELARALTDSGDPGPSSFPRSLRELVDVRLAGLDRGALEALLLAAAATRPRVAWIQRVLEDRDAAELLGHAEAAGIVEIELGHVRFVHPLLATGVYAAATAAERRSAHRRLAGVVDDAEERARHLGLASVVADPEIVAALEAGAAAARTRGAPSDAAELLEIALNLGDEHPGRMIDAAEHRFAAGDSARARTLLERATGVLAAGPERGRALALLGTIRCRDDSYEEGAALLEQALAESGPGAARVALTLELAYVLANVGRNHDALSTVLPAVADAVEIGDPGLLAEALAVTSIIRFLSGQGVDEPALARAQQLEDPDRRTFFQSRPSLIAALLLLWTGKLDEAQRALDGVRQACIERGEESELVYATRHTAGLACARGDLKRARQIVADGLQRASQLDSRMARAIALADQATVAAWTGGVEEARRAAGESLTLFKEIGSFAGTLMPVEALSGLELSLGDADAAARWIALPAAAVVAEVGDPAVVPFVADAVEALLASERVEEALPLVEWLETRSAALGRAPLLAVASRCRGIMMAARGDVPAAAEALQQAVADHDRFPIAFERARTLLVLGQIERRLRRRRAARASLEDARSTFDGLGAVLWVTRAEAELERLGPRRGAGDDLTPGEQRVAELAATGLPNRAVAAALFISPKTVEANLARVYRKLGIRSRAQLGHHMAAKD